MRYWKYLLVIALAIQTGFWWSTKHIFPDMDVVPQVPSKQALQVLSFGDEEFLFRLIGFQLGNAGDTFGRFTALHEYDMERIYRWFTLLDSFNDTSDLLPSMAAYYFSQTQNTPDARYLANYLYEHSAHRPQDKWWWLTQGAYIANHKLDDIEFAKKIAEPLRQARNIPLWAQQMPAILYEKQGEFEAAFEIMEEILKNEQEIPEGELRYIRYFFEERIGKLEELDPEFKKRLDEAEQQLIESRKREQQEAESTSDGNTAAKN
jgi:hypothetical protein